MRFKSRAIALCLVLIFLLTGCQNKDDVLFSNYNVKEVQKEPIIEMTKLDLSGPENSGINSEDEAKELDSSFDPDEEKTFDYERFILVGDSRTNGIRMAVGATAVDGIADTYTIDEKYYFICKDNTGLSWLRSSAIDSINELVTEKTALVFHLGVNDPDNAQQYASLIKNNAGRWGCDIYYAAPTPCNLNTKQDYNEAVKRFNKNLKSLLSGTVHWIDTYSYVEKKMEDGVYSTRPDQIHYNDVTYKGIYSYIKENVGTVGTGGKKSTGGAVSDELLFFTKFESGSDAYNQTGGDSGNACGKYQFDYRYALLPFVRWAYQEDPDLCQEFKQYASLGDGDKGQLQGNQSFYNAWHTIYKRDPEGFSDLQDLYAKQQYYDTAETYLKQNGIDVSNRPDVVKGAIFSYSIQHGQVTAAQQIASVVNNQMSDRAFINAIYDKRSASYPAYVNRYNQERNDALALL